MDNKRFVFCVIFILCLTAICMMLGDVYKTTHIPQNVIIEQKLDSLQEVIDSNKHSIVVYKDKMTNEILQIDCISNDSAIVLFRELINE